MTERKAQLIECLKGCSEDAKSIVMPLIDDMCFIENQLDSLRGLPLIIVNPNNTAMQKSTPSAKLYKELLQQYINVVKVVSKAIGISSDDEEESPLRAYLRTVQGFN